MSLRDQFKKAKILSDKETRRLEHEARVERATKGREGLEQEVQARHKEVEQLQQQDRDKVRRDQERIERERRQQEELAAARSLLAEAKKPGPGTVKFYFQAEDGTLPWLELSPREAQEVQAGAVCVVRGGPPATHTYRLLTIELAKRVARVMPEAVVHAARGVALR